MEGPRSGGGPFASYSRRPSSWRAGGGADCHQRVSLVADAAKRSRDTEDVDRPITDELLTIIEVAATATLCMTPVSFDLDDIDAAFVSSMPGILAGEAAAHSHTWSLIAQAYAAFNRHQLPPTTPDWVNIDHRRGPAFAPGDMTPIHSFRLGPRAGKKNVHRGCASTQQPRSGRHPYGTLDLARGLRSRVAGDRDGDGRRRPVQPWRDLRRGRHRCRAREVR